MNSEILTPPIGEEFALKNEKLAQPILDNFLSFVGNNEAKCLTFSAMEAGVYYTNADLRSLLIGLQEERDVWIMDGKALASYANRFVNAGLGQRLDGVGVRGGVGITKNDPDQLGEAFSGLMLAFSLRHPDISLSRFLGATASRWGKNKGQLDDNVIENPNRSPSTRLKIFWELLTSQLPISQAELERQMGVPTESLQDHLASLALNGVIQVDTIIFGEDFVRHKRSDKQTEIKRRLYRGRATLATILSEIFQQNPDKKFTRKQLITLIVQGDPEHYAWLLKESSLSKFSSYIQDLENIGFITTENPVREGKAKVTLSGHQRSVLLDFVSLVDKFQSLDSEFLRQCIQRGRDIVSNPSLASELLIKAKDSSNCATPLDHTAVKYEIETIKQSSERKLTRAEILRELYARGVKISSVTYSNLMNRGKS